MEVLQKMDIKHIGFILKNNLLRFATAVGCTALGIIIGILLAKNVATKNDWLIGILTGLITSIVVSVFLDNCNKATQKKKDVAIKRASIFHFWNCFWKITIAVEKKRDTVY